MNRDVPREPHALEWLAHFHGRVQIVDAHEPRGGEEIHPDIRERVLHDLMVGGIHPQRDLRGLVHLALEILLGALLALLALRCALFLFRRLPLLLL